MQKRRMIKRYFSLIEVMIVVVIISMTAGVIGMKIFKSLDQAKWNNTKTQIMVLHEAVKGYYLDMSEFPSSLNDLVTSPGSDKWDGPYIDSKTLPKDAWEEEFHYDYPGTNGDYDIYSYGGDKSPGGEGYSKKDVNNWER